MPSTTVPAFGAWEVTRGGGGMLHGIVVAVHEGGVEFYDLIGTNASKSKCTRLREGGVAIAMHTSPSHCHQKNCLCIAVGVLLWHLQHRIREWDKPPAQKKIAIPVRECRAMFDIAASRVATPRNLTLRRTGLAPVVLKEFAKVAKELPPLRGKGLVQFAPS